MLPPQTIIHIWLHHSNDCNKCSPLENLETNHIVGFIGGWELLNVGFFIIHIQKCDAKDYKQHKMLQTKVEIFLKYSRDMT